MTICSVPGCQSNYRSKEAVPTFPYPKDEKRRKQWLKQIGLSKVGKGARVCKKHFLDSYIIQPEENVTKEGKPRKYIRKLPDLREKAVPTIFPMGPKKSKRRSSCEEKEVPEKITKFDQHYVDHTYISVKGQKHDKIESVRTAKDTSTTNPETRSLYILLTKSNISKQETSKTQEAKPSPSTIPITPSIPVVLKAAKPTRFEFDSVEEPSTSIPELEPTSSSDKDDIITSMRERILHLERENNELRYMNNRLKRIYKQGKGDNFVGNKNILWVRPNMFH